ncbi:peptidoglycan bridge formation glycyltransferase FemA/FemB family protein [Patescibacteria group bacterium]|nr:peptidoglycan bridge formation glycyltransferase FemA/FemB family protein [Patescibacteria group bacterium]MBU1682430.1 peptidoglycan bridge formation glycyltransferase FemA/FemB family protein [Patescibacteria group bacterium]MBU1934717.1 peptidoglycan bridge formation glycyltransferase FemA/FemB family protein [Patescibacteria group bacterium]
MTNWKDFKRRNLWQHPIWEGLKKSAGRKTWQLEVEGASALVVQYEMPFGLNWLEVPRGPLFENEKSLSEIMKKIEELGKNEQSVFIRMSPYQQFKIQDSRFKIAKKDYHPETSLIMDLTRSEEDILAEMKQKGRYNIKVAERHNVTVSPSDDMDAFYNVLQTTANRDGFGVHPKSYYKNMLDSLGDHAQLLLAEYEGRVIAGGIFVYLDVWGIYYYGASEYNYRNVMASYLVQWTAMKEAKKRGCKYYDFLGIAPEGATNHPWLGVTSFKKKFGGEVVNYPKAKEMILRPFWYWVYRIVKRG